MTEKRRYADWRILACISWISFHGHLLASFSGAAAGKQKYFFNHISIAEKNDNRKAGYKLILSASGFLFNRNNAPARELDVCRPSVFTNLFFIQT